MPSHVAEHLTRGGFILPFQKHGVKSHPVRAWNPNSASVKPCCFCSRMAVIWCTFVGCQSHSQGWCWSLLLSNKPKKNDEDIRISRSYQLKCCLHGRIWGCLPPNVDLGGDRVLLFAAVLLHCSSSSCIIHLLPREIYFQWLTHIGVYDKTGEDSPLNNCLWAPSHSDAVPGQAQ